jgi:hypothetical protein
MLDSATPNRPDGGGPSSHDAGAGLVVVTVTETVVTALTGREGCRYTSPPQTRKQAMELVHLVLGRAPDADGAPQWTAPIAGGRRVVTLTEEPSR